MAEGGWTVRELSNTKHRLARVHLYGRGARLVVLDDSHNASVAHVWLDDDEIEAFIAAWRARDRDA